MERKFLADKLHQYGPAAMTTMELMSLVLGDTETAYNVMHASMNSLKNVATKYPSELCRIPGMTKQKSSMLIAMYEIARRKSYEELERRTVASSFDVAAYLKEVIGDKPHEVFMIIFLNRSNHIIENKIISEGGITGTVADPRIILKHAINLNAVSLILSHNHPSGSLKPSKADEDLTFKIKEASKYFDIKVLDHIIVSQDGYYSFADEGIL